MPAPKVSVCIPTYCGAATISAAIKSVLAQSHADFELIVIDDHSPDKTMAIVDQFDDPRLVYIRNEENLGAEGNWNRCLELARGQYFKLLPHDDVLHPNCLERQAAMLDADPNEDIAIVFCSRQVLAPDGRVLLHRGYPSVREGPITSERIMRACVRRGTNLLGEPGAVLFRKSLAARIGSFDATFPYVIDLDYWFRLLAHGNAYYCREALAGFRIGENSWSVAIGGRQGEDFRKFIERCASQGVLQASRFDYLCNHITSRLNNLVRLIFYRLLIK